MHIREKVECAAWGLALEEASESDFKVMGQQGLLGHVWHRGRLAKQEKMNPKPKRTVRTVRRRMGGMGGGVSSYSS